MKDLKKRVKNGSNGRAAVKKKNLTNEDLAKKIDQLGGAMHSDVAGLHKKIDDTKTTLSAQIELVASAVADLNERADKSDANHEILKSEIKGVETRLGHKIEALGTRLDDVVLNYEKKETHHRDLQKMHKRVSIVEQKLTHV